MPKLRPSSAAFAVLLFSAPLAARAAEFKGENCAACHERLRDAEGPPKQEAKDAGRRDFIVIGGGLSGLTAGHFLKDRDVLVLEKEERPGGHARREAFPNGRYPVAAVYTEEPYGPIKKLYDDLGLQPSVIKEPAEVLKLGGAFISRYFSTGAPDFPPDSRPEMEKLAKELKRLRALNITVPIKDSDPELLKAYEGLTFWDWLTGFGPTAAKLGDMFAKDMFGTGAKDVSAFMGIDYMVDEYVPGYSWEGGLGALSEAAAAELGPRLETGAMVVSVRQDKDGAEVLYLKGGTLFKARAGAVIFATHLFTTRRLAKDLSKEKDEAIGKLKYSAYVTVPLSFTEKVWDRSWSLWSADSFFTDITFAEPDRLVSASTQAVARAGQVGVAYIPLGLEDGRAYLMGASDEEIIGKVKADLDRLLPGAAAKVQDARVIRWGHAMTAMGPDFFKTLQPVLAKPEGRYFFAGEDTQAPALEGAVFSGWIAAREARAKLSPPRTLDCADPQSVRDFKDLVYGRLNPSPGVDERWAVCLCGRAGREAGFNEPRPPIPSIVPVIPPYSRKDPRASLELEKNWFQEFLPVNRFQAGRLIDCVWGRKMPPITP